MPINKLLVYSLQFTEKIKKTVHCTLSTANSQKGFSPIIFIVIILFIFGASGGVYYYLTSTRVIPEVSEVNPASTQSSTPEVTLTEQATNSATPDNFSNPFEATQSSNPFDDYENPFNDQ